MSLEGLATAVIIIGFGTTREGLTGKGGLHYADPSVKSRHGSKCGSRTVESHEAHLLTRTRIKPGSTDVCHLRAEAAAAKTQITKLRLD